MIDTVKKMLSFLNPRSGSNGVRPPSSAVLKALERGILSCQGCGSSYGLEGRKALSMFNCGKCGGLVFVPWHVDGVWAFQPMAVGGFGSMYHGVDVGTGRHMAMKVIRNYHNADRLVCELFEEECRVAYSLGEHPNIAATHAYGTTDTAAYMCMDYVPGESLADIVEARGGLPAELVLGYLRDLVAALGHILSAGYLHRDVKPENVIITPAGSAVLVDYGSCMSVEQAAAIDGGPIFASPHFCPPERYNGKAEDHRSDIYSLGHVGYFCLTGKPYASGDEGIVGVMRTHTRKMRVPLAARLHKQDPRVVALIDSAIKWEIGERCGSYEALYGRIVELLKGSLITGRAGDSGRHRRPMTGLHAVRA